MPTKSDGEPTPEVPSDAETAWLTEIRKPISHRQIFLLGQIALKLARLPGRLEVDQDEAYRVLNDFIARYKRLEFAEDEVLVLVADPPHFAALKPRLDEVEREYRTGPAVAPVLARRGNADACRPETISRSQHLGGCAAPPPRMVPGCNLADTC